GREDRRPAPKMAAPVATPLSAPRPASWIPIPDLHSADRVVLDPGVGSSRQRRIFFEDVIRENLDIGRPKQVQLIFARGVTKAPPGSFRTRVITDGVIPSLHIDYKGTRIKQYHKEGQALRTEPTVNNTKDFYVGKSLPTLPALRQIGFAANR